MATLGLKEMGIFFFGIMKRGGDAMPLFLLDHLLIYISYQSKFLQIKKSKIKISREGNSALTDGLGGKEAWRPPHFS